METLVRLGSLLSPSFFAILAGLTLTVAAVLLIAGKCNVVEPQAKGTSLSTVEPLQNRAGSYLVLAFGWSIPGIVLSFILNATSSSFSGNLILVILLLFCLLFTLCFSYAGAGTMLSAMTGQESRFVHWFCTPVDTIITRFGDLLTAGFFRQSWYRGTVTKMDLPKEVSSRTAISRNEREAKAAEEREMVLRHKLAKYEVRLTPRQREELAEEMRIMEELRNMYP